MLNILGKLQGTRIFLRTGEFEAGYITMVVHGMVVPNELLLRW